MGFSQADLQEWFIYQPETGEFFWRKIPERTRGGISVGGIAGSWTTGGNGSHAKKRRVLWLRRKRMYAGRAAYVYVHGDIPETALVDHLDGDVANDRIANLRLASSIQNAWNKTGAAESSRSKGVSLDIRGRYKARILGPDGKKINLGTWPSEAEAHAAYMGASAVLHGEFSILKRGQIWRD